MHEKTGFRKSPLRRQRNLRRARRYIRANKGALARLLSAYRVMVADDPNKAFLDER